MFCLKLDMNFIYKCCNVHFVPLKDEEEQIVLFKMNKKRTNCTFLNEQVVPFEIEKKCLCNYRTLYIYIYIQHGFFDKFPQKFSLGAILVRKVFFLRFHCVHLNPFCSECCTDRSIAMQISKWPRKNLTN